MAANMWKIGRSAFKIKHLGGDFVGGVCLAVNNVAHLIQTVFMMLNNLLGTVAVVFEHAPMRGQHKLHLKALNLLLGVEKIL